MNTYHSRFALMFLMALCLATALGATELEDLSLEDLLNTKITTASKFSQRVSESPSSATVIRREEIRSHGWHNLHEALVGVRGFEISSATDYRYLGLRGFSQPGDYNMRILLLIDGIPTNDGVFDQAMIGSEFPLDINLVDRIEVVPGPGSALYGGNAYLAVVNVITSKNNMDRSVTLGVGSAGLRQTQASAGGKDNAGRHWLVSVSGEHSAGESIYFPQWNGVAGSDGWAREMDGETQQKLFLRYGDDNLSGHLLHGRRSKDSAGALYSTDFDAPVINVDETTQLGLRLQHPMGNGWTLEGQAYAGEFRWNGSYRYSTVWEIDTAESGWYGLNAQLTGTPWDRQTWVLGISHRNDGKRIQQNVGIRTESQRSTLSLYAQDEIRFSDQATLSLGLRSDSDSNDIHQVSPRGALVLHLPEETVLKLMSGKAFRPPNAYESDYSYPGVQTPGGTLKPERIATTEIALEKALGTQGRWSISAYRNQFQDLLGIVTDPTTLIQQIQTIGDASTEGLELGGRYRLDNGIDLSGSVSRQRSEDMASAPLPNSAEQLVKLLAIVPVGTYELGWETYYTGARRDVFGQQIGGQTVSHAALSGRIHRNVRWQFRVNNLFDRALQTVVGAEYSVGTAGNVPTLTNPGRQTQFHLTLDF